ncbi:MAG: DUF2752 domain-containing protein [Bacteroidetes bacterium]|nr:DUF2752 domain-containing protein [Bacteroidota bacterium]
MKPKSGPVFWFACPSKKYFGLDCPGCGMQRACYSLVQGKPIQSLKYNPGALPFLLLLVFTMLHLRFRFKHGHRVILAGFIVTVAAMWTAFLFKLSHL